MSLPVAQPQLGESYMLGALEKKNAGATAIAEEAG